MSEFQVLGPDAKEVMSLVMQRLRYNFGLPGRLARYPLDEPGLHVGLDMMACSRHGLVILPVLP